MCLGGDNVGHWSSYYCNQISVVVGIMTTSQVKQIKINFSFHFRLSSPVADRELSRGD